MNVRRSVPWLRAHPRAGDALLALLITSISLVFLFTEHTEEYRTPNVWGTLLVIVATAPVAVRRQSPVGVLFVVTVAQMAAEAYNFNGAGWSGVLIASYTLGSQRSGAIVRRLTLGLFVVLVAFVGVGVAHDDVPWQALISAPVTLVGAVALGDNMRRRRERAAELAEKAERLEREREMQGHQRVLDERARIARELHDVVAHSVSLMVIQAAAARRQLHRDPQQADLALATVESTGREAMSEMRRILGVLRDDTTSLKPQPSLDDVGALVAGAADLPVHLHTAGSLAGLPAAIGVSAYRVVQEALTNVRRHAGPVQHVDVVLAHDGDTLVVEVADDGRGASADVSPDGAGFGVAGMRERVAAYHGELTAGPRSGGGWRVRAIFPLGAA